MKVYIDSCVFQDLKKEENKELFEFIKSSKPKNIYCFSEAHLQDLTRDRSDEKFKDMNFIEQIVDNNCYCYDKKIIFQYCTPTEYYNYFEWPDLTSFNSDNSIFSGFESLFKLIPLDFKLFMPNEQIPLDCPDEFIELLQKTTNFYDFSVNFLSFTETLTNEQKKFKEFVTYLHKNSLIKNVYENIGIKGFDGDKIIDKESIRLNQTVNYTMLSKRCCT